MAGFSRVVCLEAKISEKPARGDDGLLGASIDFQPGNTWVYDRKALQIVTRVTRSCGAAELR
jgi:hypothetical protein